MPLKKKSIVSTKNTTQNCKQLSPNWLDDDDNGNGEIVFAIENVIGLTPDNTANSTVKYNYWLSIKYDG